jgi:hypothetical protein
MYNNIYWKQQAAASGYPVFPISVRFNPTSRRWEKRPLTKHGHLDASRDSGSFGKLWEHKDCNGYGVRTGDGLLVLDLDAHKPDGGAGRRWIVERGLRDIQTWIVKTVSGGWHLYFRTEGEYLDLPTRAGICGALDARGDGGWVAVAAGYELHDDHEPALLPEAVAAELRAGYTGTGGGAAVQLGLYSRPETSRVDAKLDRALQRNRTLRMRWIDNLKSRGDVTRSARDHSVAFLMAGLGFTAQEIAYALLERFEHGACRDPATPYHRQVRAAQRCAAKAVAAYDELRRAVASNMAPQTTSVDEYLSTLVGV